MQLSPRTKSPGMIKILEAQKKIASAIENGERIGVNHPLSRQLDELRIAFRAEGSG